MFQVPPHCDALEKMEAVAAPANGKIHLADVMVQPRQRGAVQ